MQNFRSEILNDHQLQLLNQALMQYSDNIQFIDNNLEQFKSTIFAVRSQNGLENTADAIG